MTKSEYMSRVLGIMNEASVNGEELPGGDASLVENVIASVFLDAWRLVARSCPVSLLDSVSFDGEVVHDKTTGVGFVRVPADFFRLSSFQLEGWRRPAREVVVEGSDTERLQWSVYTRGGVSRPVVVFGDGVLRYYSLPPGKDAVIKEALYVPMHEGLPEMDEETGIDARLESAFCHVAAGLSFSRVGDDDRSAMMLKLASSFLPGWSNFQI